MSEEENNIDQLFNDAAHSQKAPQYDSSYWAEMNTFLNARDARRRGLILWTSAGILICLFLLTTLFILDTKKVDTRVQYAQTQLDLNTNKIETPKEQSDNNYGKNLSHSAKDEFQTKTDKNKVQEHTSNTTNQRDLSDFSSKEPILSNNQSTTVKNSDEENVGSNERIINEKAVLDEKSNHIDLGNAEDVNFSLPIKGINQLTQNDPGNLFDSKVKHTSKTRLSLYAKLSGGLMENYKTGNPYQSGVLDLSINLETRFNSLLLRTGIGTQYTTHANLVVSQRARVYGFGVMNQQNDLAYQDLLDLYIPIEFGYYLNKTSFGIGVEENYLLTTSMDLNIYKDQVLANTEKYYGNKDGLKSFSTQGYIWMEQKLLPNFSIGLKVGTNISGRIQDGKYFNQSATINPIYGQLTFRLNIR